MARSKHNTVPKSMVCWLSEVCRSTDAQWRLKTLGLRATEGTIINAWNSQLRTGEATVRWPVQAGYAG